MPGAPIVASLLRPSSSLLLVVANIAPSSRPGAPSSVLVLLVALLVVWPGAPSSVLVPSSDARSPYSSVLAPSSDALCS